MTTGFAKDLSERLSTPLQCPACGATTVSIMEVQTVFDKLAWAAWCAPVLCRICHSKFYRKIRKELEEITRAESG
jgi:transcription elongation factor Elf1